MHYAEAVVCCTFLPLTRVFPNNTGLQADQRPRLRLHHPGFHQHPVMHVGIPDRKVPCNLGDFHRLFGGQLIMLRVLNECFIHCVCLLVR